MEAQQLLGIFFWQFSFSFFFLFSFDVGLILFDVSCAIVASPFPRFSGPSPPFLFTSVFIFSNSFLALFFFFLNYLSAVICTTTLFWRLFFFGQRVARFRNRKKKKDSSKTTTQNTERFTEFRTWFAFQNNLASNYGLYDEAELVSIGFDGISIDFDSFRDATSTITSKINDIFAIFRDWCRGATRAKQKSHKWKGNLKKIYI